jgi:hypothetical protein
VPTQELAARLLGLQRLATKQHLDAHTWRIVDQMRLILRRNHKQDRMRQALADGQYPRSLDRE